MITDEYGHKYVEGIGLSWDYFNVWTPMTLALRRFSKGKINQGELDKEFNVETYSEYIQRKDPNHWECILQKADPEKLNTLNQLVNTFKSLSFDQKCGQSRSYQNQLEGVLGRAKRKYFNLS